MRQLLTYSLAGLFLVGALFVYFLYVTPKGVTGSVIQGNEYNATSTAPTASEGAFVLTTTKLLKTGQGSLAQVCITGDNTGTLNFYNATTSDVSKRTGNVATTTILLTSIAGSAPEDCYVFDAVFTTGLLLDLEGTGVPTTTIMWR